MAKLGELKAGIANIKAQGGELKVETKEGVGSVFSIII